MHELEISKGSESCNKIHLMNVVQVVDDRVLVALNQQCVAAPGREVRVLKLFVRGSVEQARVLAELTDQFVEHRGLEVSSAGTNNKDTLFAANSRTKTERSRPLK